MKWNGTPLNVILKDDTKLWMKLLLSSYGGSQKRAALTTLLLKWMIRASKKAAYSKWDSHYKDLYRDYVLSILGQPGSSPNITLRGEQQLRG